MIGPSAVRAEITEAARASLLQRIVRQRDLSKAAEIGAMANWVRNLAAPEIVLMHALLDRADG